MARKASGYGNEEKPKKTMYTIKLDDEQMEKLGLTLDSRGWFPYEVQYLRRSGLEEATAMVTLQFRRVTRRVQMDNSQFEYQRGDQVVIDRTDRFLQQVGLGNGP